MNAALDAAQTAAGATERPLDPAEVMHGSILYLEGITVSFDGFRALNDLSLYIARGELRCIIGP
ncbi:MAG TPA: hypothetical protein VMT89_07925, partial [Candidatus Acidoferrales bacterium]|nr:hypothetical protein [Candidatus Acidoferrales bacterium]